MAHTPVRRHARAVLGRMGLSVALALALVLAQASPSIAPHAAANTLPVVTASPSSGYAPLLVEFAIADAAAATTVWSFGDGASATVDPGGPGPTHVYASPGTFEVTVEVRLDGALAPAPAPTVIVVARNPADPLASLGAASTLAAVGRPLTLTSTSTGTIEETTWDLGDGTTVSGLDRVSHSYVAAGTYRVVLTVRGAGLESVAAATVRVLPAWTGRRNLFRADAFVRQYRSGWCTAATVQFMRNASLGLVDTSLSLQRRIMTYERSVDTLAASRGSDPRGMARALVQYGAGASYAERTFPSMRRALEHAARRIRITGRPVALLVWGGSHVWTMHGFRAAADPAFTSANVVTHVIVSGSLGKPNDPVNRPIALADLGGRYGFRQYWQPDGLARWYGKWVVVSP